MSTTLAAYKYIITCTTTQCRCYELVTFAGGSEGTTVPVEFMLMVEKLNDAPIKIAMWTQQDSLMSRVLHYISEGWPQSLSDKLNLCWTKWLERTLYAGCLMWAGRVVVPPPGWEKVLIDLHSGHPGATSMKALSRSLVWWPGLESDIEKMVRKCSQCQQNQPSPAVPSASMADLGLGYTLTILYQWKVKCFLWWLTPTLSGLRCFLWQMLPHWLQYKNYANRSQDFDFLTPSYQTMVHNLLPKSSKIFASRMELNTFVWHPITHCPMDSP